MVAVFAVPVSRARSVCWSVRRRHGACDALVWLDEQHVYRCGLIERPEQHLLYGLNWLAPALKRIAHRYISAGSGCDCSLIVEPKIPSE